jgi:hypothetical protein
MNMASITTQIKNAITSHLGGSLFGKDIYGRHEYTIYQHGDHTMVIEVTGASRFERYGRVVVYHPFYGKWQAALLSEYHCGKPVQVLTVEQIRENIAHTPSQDFIYKIYGGEKPNTAPASWDPYWETRSM